MALLEPVSVFWWLLGIWLAGRAAKGGWRQPLVLGIAIVALVLAKTTAIALVPSILFFLYARARQDRAGWARPAVVAIGTAIALWCVYFFAWVRPKYLADFKFVFAINNYRAHLTVLPYVLSQMLVKGLWINAVLVPVAIAMLVVAAIRMRSLWQSPLFGAMVVAIVADSAFILYHGNLQPHYYLVLAIPLVAVVVMGTERLWLSGMKPVAIGVVVILLVTAGVMTAKTLNYARHPEYSYRDTAVAVAQKMRAEGEGAPVLFAGAGDDISLFTGVRAISMYEPHGVQPLLDEYQPRWMGAWQDWEQAFPQQVSAEYELQAEGTFRVYDDQPRHGVFVLYKMTPRLKATVEHTK
jgi:hypothetical protein